ncbi:MAG TPA: PEP-CTERM sorting domain-containing protein, partial [Burkholderiaceae bacterium]|nr:PEP-CTERM sorting domain-containing protein [Burkholderiaceae bacterium]
PAQAVTVLYSQDFDNPTGFVNDGGDINIFRTVNQLYGNQPPGFTFAQAHTVETLLVGGTQAFGTGYKDPQGIAGTHVVSMLSDVENDLLGLAFNVGANSFLNFRLDVSSIDLDRFSGPFVPAAGAAPTFRFSLFDNPGGANGVGSGTALSFADLTGAVGPNKFTFNWTNIVAGLSTAGNTNGNVILRIDLLSGGYAAMDNFVIAAADRAGEVPGGVVPGIPEPETWALLLAGLAVVAGRALRRGGK